MSMISSQLKVHDIISKETCLVFSRWYPLKAMKYDKHPRYLLQQKLGIKPPCTSIPEQAALILLLYEIPKPVLSISSIRTTFLQHGLTSHAYFKILQLKPFPTNIALITTMQSHRSDCVIPQFHNHLIYKPQLLSYLGIIHTSIPTCIRFRCTQNVP